MSLLITVKEAEFTFLREKTNSTAGNLSVQIQKLKDAAEKQANEPEKKQEESNKSDSNTIKANMN